MRISEVTVLDLANFMRLDDPSEIELNEIETMRTSAISYMSDYTGLTEEELDEKESLTHVLYVLVADQFDNRNLILDKTAHVSPAVQTALNMHSVNLL